MKFGFNFCAYGRNFALEFAQFINDEKLRKITAQTMNTLYQQGIVLITLQFNLAIRRDAR